MIHESWHLSKTITVGNLIASMIALSALIGAYYALDKRVSLVERAQISMIEHQRAETIARKDDVMRVCQRLDTIQALIMSVHFGTKKPNLTNDED